MAGGTKKKIQAAEKLRRARKWPAALDLYHQILRKRPRDVDALVGCGDVLQRLGRFTEAAQYLEKAARIDSEHPAVLTERGRGLIRARRFEDALKMLHGAVMRDPNHVDALLEIGRLHLALFRPELAAAVFRRGLEVIPNDAELTRLLGDAYQNEGRWQEACRTYEQALQLADDEPVLHFNLAATYRNLGRFEDALREYEESLKRQPDLIEANAGIAGVYESMERYADADGIIAEFRTEMAQGKLDSRRVVFAEVLVRAAKRTGESPSVVRFLSELKDEQGLSIPQRAQVQFQLGSLQEHDGKHEAAWSAYQTANALYPRSFKPESYHEFIDDLISSYGSEPLRTMREKIDSSDKRSDHDSGNGMIFVIGMPCAGASMVEQILGAHPMAHAAGGLETLSRLVSSIPHRLQEQKTPYPHCIEQLTSEHLEGLATSYLQQVHSLSPAGDDERLRIIDRLPQNFLHLGLISVLFPQARIVHCRRDRADTCCACFATPLSAVHGYSNHWDDLEAAFDEYERLMNHWESVIDPAQICTVQYEDLHADLEGGARKLVQFVGLDWVDQCGQILESAGGVFAAEGASGVGRAQNFASEIRALRESLVATAGAE